MHEYYVILTLDNGGDWRGVLAGNTRYHLFEQAFAQISPPYQHGAVEFFYCEPNQLGGV